MFKFIKEIFLTALLVIFSSSAYGSTPAQIIKKNINKYHSLEGYNGEGKAKVYSQHYHNKKTASGMKFSHYQYTAASVKLPLMSVVRITNKRNGKTIHVLINDRGPYKTNAIVDLSKATAAAINYHSSDQVIVEFDIDKTLKLAASKDFNLFLESLKKTH